jgi:hypothetical protein
MRKALAFAVLVVVAMLAIACGGATPTPTAPPAPTAAVLPFASAVGGFSVLSPATLAETTEIATTEIGNLEVHTFQGDSGGFSYFVVYSDYPESYRAVDAAGLLASARDGQVNSTGGSLVMDGPITLSGVQGRDIRIKATADDGQMVILRSRLYWAPTRLYQVLVLAPEGREDDSAVGAFLESFKLTDRAN